MGSTDGSESIKDDFGYLPSVQVERTLVRQLPSAPRIWETAAAADGSNRQDELLEAGWEPFSVTADGDRDDWVWFRRLKP